LEEANGRGDDGDGVEEQGDMEVRRRRWEKRSCGWRELELRCEDDEVAGETALWETVEEEDTTEWRTDKGETVVTGGTRSGD